MVGLALQSGQVGDQFHIRRDGLPYGRVEGWRTERRHHARRQQLKDVA